MRVPRSDLLTILFVPCHPAPLCFVWGRNSPGIASKMSPRKGKSEAAGSESGAIYAVLGGGEKAGVYTRAKYVVVLLSSSQALTRFFRVPCIRAGYDKPILPIVIMCRSEAEAQHVHRSLADLFKTIESQALSDTRAVPEAARW